MIHRLLDRLAERYSEREHKLEAMRAREEYFDRAGKVFDDDAELFDGRMAAFLVHPPDAREVVLAWVERAVATGVAHEEILFHLSRQHIRWHRHGHVGAAKVYRDA